MKVMFPPHPLCHGIERVDASSRYKRYVLIHLRCDSDRICVVIRPAWPARPAGGRILSGGTKKNSHHRRIWRLPARSRRTEALSRHPHRCFLRRDMFLSAPPLYKGEASGGIPPSKQRPPCQGSLFLLVSSAAKTREKKASSRPAMGRHEGGGASNTALLRPALALTATRPPGSLSPGQSPPMSCCRWCFGCTHAKSAA
jgi:hypothetical protein